MLAGERLAEQERGHALRPATTLPERIERGDRGLLLTGFTAELASVKFIRACESVNVENISLHSLRHTYASWAHMSGADPASTKAQLGHKTDSMMDRYRHLLPNHRAKQAAALNGVFSLPPGNTIEGEAVKALPAPDSDQPTS